MRPRLTSGNASVCLRRHLHQVPLVLARPPKMVATLAPCPTVQYRPPSLAICIYTALVRMQLPLVPTIKVPRPPHPPHRISTVVAPCPRCLYPFPLLSPLTRPRSVVPARTTCVTLVDHQPYARRRGRFISGARTRTHLPSMHGASSSASFCFLCGGSLRSCLSPRPVVLGVQIRRKRSH